MKLYSEYTSIYVRDICDALNEAGIVFNQIQPPYSPNSFESLTNFIQNHVIMPLTVFTYLDERGLVNTGRCPYTGQRIDNSALKWTYMRSRSIYVSDEGLRLMKKEDDEEYEKVFGEPAPKRNTGGGCYIATACYGNEEALEVKLLRRYRDEILLNTWYGQLFVKIYYSISPPIARILYNKEQINSLVRKKVIDRIVRKISSKY